MECVFTFKVGENVQLRHCIESQIRKKAGVALERLCKQQACKPWSCLAFCQRLAETCLLHQVLGQLPGSLRLVCVTDPGISRKLASWQRRSKLPFGRVHKGSRFTESLVVWVADQLDLGHSRYRRPALRWGSFLSPSPFALPFVRGGSKRLSAMARLRSEMTEGKWEKGVKEVIMHRYSSFVWP